MFWVSLEKLNFRLLYTKVIVQVVQDLMENDLIFLSEIKEFFEKN